MKMSLVSGSEYGTINSKYDSVALRNTRVGHQMGGFVHSIDP